jgi:ComF family protein
MAPRPPEALGRLAGQAGSFVLDLVLPPRCRTCFAPTGSHAALCAPCWAGLPLIERPFCERLGVPFPYDHGAGMLSAEAIAEPPSYGRARSAARYEGSAVDLVRRLKFGDRVELAPLMGRLMASAGAEILAGADLLIPVPLHRLRLWRRRFNQAALLCDAVAARCAAVHDPFLLERRRRTRSQVGLTRQERARNVQGAFRVPDARRQALVGRRVVLVDDVVTTGATVDAAARVLLRAGAANVDVLSFARVVTTLS